MLQMYLHAQTVHMEFYTKNSLIWYLSTQQYFATLKSVFDRCIIHAVTQHC